jgi:hypothetical protein
MNLQMINSETIENRIAHSDKLIGSDDHPNALLSVIGAIGGYAYGRNFLKELKSDVSKGIYALISIAGPAKLAGMFPEAYQFLVTNHPDTFSIIFGGYIGNIGAITEEMGNIYLKRKKKTKPPLYTIVDKAYKSAEKHTPNFLRERPKLLAPTFGTLGTSIVLGVTQLAAKYITPEFYKQDFKTLEEACMMGLPILTAVYVAAKWDDVKKWTKEHPVYRNGMIATWATSMTMAAINVFK